MNDQFLAGDLSCFVFLGGLSTLKCQGNGALAYKIYHYMYKVKRGIHPTT